jgi:phosphotransferase system HPr-like phosphotransfer protein
MRRIAKKIVIDTIPKVKDFVQQTAKFLYEVDVSSGNHTVDGKSLMGLLSLDLSKPVVISYAEDDAGLADIFLSKYFVKGGKG